MKKSSFLPEFLQKADSNSPKIWSTLVAPGSFFTSSSVIAPQSHENEAKITRQAENGISRVCLNFA